HQFGPAPLLPKPVQQPHPLIWIAAIQTAASFVWAGEQGYKLMIVPYLSAFDSVAANLRAYRESYARAGHGPQAGKVQMSFHSMDSLNKLWGFLMITQGPAQLA